MNPRRDPVLLRLAWTGLLALLALAAWVAVAAGAGRGVAPYAGPPQPPASLPELAPAADAGQARAAALAAASERPAFAPDRQPHPFLMAVPAAAGASADGLRLTGTVITPELRLATVSTGQGPSLRLRLGGPAVEGWSLVALEGDRATVEGPGGTRVLVLEAAPATAVAPARSATAPAAVQADGKAASGTGAGAASAAAAAGAALPAPTAAPVFPVTGTAGRGLAAGSSPRELSEQVLATRQRTENERRLLREQRQRRGNDGMER